MTYNLFGYLCTVETKKKVRFQNVSFRKDNDLQANYRTMDEKKSKQASWGTTVTERTSAPGTRRTQTRGTTSWATSTGAATHAAGSSPSPASRRRYETRAKDCAHALCARHDGRLAQRSQRQPSARNGRIQEKTTRPSRRGVTRRPRRSTPTSPSNHTTCATCSPILPPATS